MFNRFKFRLLRIHLSKVLAVDIEIFFSDTSNTENQLSCLLQLTTPIVNRGLLRKHCLHIGKDKQLRTAHGSI